MSGGELAAAVGSDRQTLRRLEERGLIATRSSRLRRAPARSSLAAPPSARASARAAGARSTRSSPPSTARLAPRAASCCTASPARARPRSTWRRSRRRWSVAAARSSSSPRSASRRRRWPASAPASATASRSSTRPSRPASATTSGGACAAARRSVCVGPRSAVFAPVRDLGLIVIDEEHDPSYKQEGDPCYDARTVARRRAEDSGAVLVAGTATPRPETWLELPRLELPRRVDGRGMPPVELVDMREADPRSGPLHADTWEALEGVRARRRQGDRDDQPPRLRALAHLPLLRAPLGLPQLRRLADRPPPQRPSRLPPLRPRRAAAARLPGVRLDHALAGRRRHRADRGAAARAPGADAGLPPRLRHRRRARRPRPHPRPLRRGARAPSSSAPRWSPRATTSPR